MAASCISLYPSFGSNLPILRNSQLYPRIVPGQSAADVASEDAREARANTQPATADVETDVWMTTEYLSVRFDSCFIKSTVIKMEKNDNVCLHEQSKAFDLDALSGDFFEPVKSYQFSFVNKKLKISVMQYMTFKDIFLVSLSRVIH